MDLWRSEPMQRIRLMVPAEAAHETIVSLGEIGLVQFVDLNTNRSAFQRTYATEVKRCDEMTRRLRFFKEQVEKEGLLKDGIGVDKDTSLDELEARLEELERELLEVNANSDRLQQNRSELVELQLVLEKAGKFFEEARDAVQPEILEAASPLDLSAPLLENAQLGQQKVTKVGFLSGLVAKEKLENFERLLFRATRGNMFLKHCEVGSLRDPATGEQVEKHVFVVFYAGERVRTKITKICEVYGANTYPFPEEAARQRQMVSEVTMRLRELSTTIEAGERLRFEVLNTLAANLTGWCGRLMREKATFHVMNKLSVDSSRKVLVGEAWVPVDALEEVKDALVTATEVSSAQTGTILEPMHPEGPPPTYFKTNKFTEGFQSIVEAYGVARYREVNPSVFTCVTFPFLFAVMFGDLGHGFLMLLFALFMVIREKALGKVQNDMFEMLFGGRYVILMMSIFSIYTGLVYNEAFSMPTSFFGGTKWVCQAEGNETLPDIRLCQGRSLSLLVDGTDPYPFGLDPVWHGTKNELTFTNSMKMKMSVVFGVLHMDLGIIMSVFNQQYFRDQLSIWCEFVPQILFLNSVFGYLAFMIVYKWCLNSHFALPNPSGPGTVNRGTADLYNVMINLFLSPGTVDPAGELYDGQARVQSILLLVAFVAIPWMLLPKPLILRSRNRNGRQEQPSGEDSGTGAAHGGAKEGAFSFGDVMVHQMIHTIEFVLGAVSNTASYLRLWALTLAHSQLSVVFYDRVLMLVVELASDPAAGLTVRSVLQIFIGFFVFAMATLGVLMVMESLSAFLHALRLHWVEFQNKFYNGDGYKFIPFSFANFTKDDL
ncbi:unnamed protein product [Ostreobium quekettii]|uniref:V-type proton ATPase subunit a n=1 Tax=Ostreobium quekettii TaxID=121088 RepID=A0A8S1JG73_9CHLO|nr:unnamed protein product [Ostreobium quekettii]